MNIQKTTSVLYIIFALQITLFEGPTTGQVIWRNITCHSTDEKYAKFEYCELRKNTTNNNMNTMATPINFNTTWDVCEFMANRKRFKSLRKFYHMISDYTNINHTCPYSHDMFITNLGSMESEINIPLISGVVNFWTAWITDGKIRVIVEGVAKYQSKTKNWKRIDKKKPNI